MADISNLEGINSDEVEKLCRANIKTEEDFFAQIDPPFFNYGIVFLSMKTGIKQERLIQFVPPERVSADLLPDIWLEGLTRRVLRETPPENPWLKRCRLRWKKFSRGLEGNWLGWQKNLPIFGLIAGLLIIVVLALRALGGLQVLPSPLGLRDQVMVTADEMESGRMLKPDDWYVALLPLERDYLKPDDQLEGLMLARRVLGQKPLHYNDVSRRQVIALRDIQADEVIRNEDVKLDWATYQPGAAIKLEEVCGRKASNFIHKDAAILSEFIKPAN